MKILLRNRLYLSRYRTKWYQRGMGDKQPEVHIDLAKKFSNQKLLRVEVQRTNKLTLDARNRKLLNSLLHNAICKYREQGTLDYREPPSYLGPRGVEYQEHTGQRTTNWSWELANANLTLPQAEGMTVMDEVWTVM